MHLFFIEADSTHFPKCPCPCLPSSYRAEEEGGGGELLEVVYYSIYFVV